MSDFGTPAFNETWRKSGFFIAVDQVSPGSNAQPRDYRSLNSAILQTALAEMGKELAKMQAALDRVGHNVRPGVSGGKLDQAALERNVIALGGWIASALETLGGMTYYLSEPGYKKVARFVQQQSAAQSHPSRSTRIAG